MTSVVGPVVLSEEAVRQHLLRHGEVVTFRHFKRSTGETWWRETRRGLKRGDCTIEYLREVDPTADETLRLHADRSGFGTVGRWKQAIKRRHGTLTGGHLYRVSVDHVDGIPSASTNH